MLERQPVLKRALINEYQLLLAAGATVWSVATLSPLPWILLLGGNLIAMPFLVERLARRMEIERKYAARKSEEMSQEQRYEELSPENRARFQKFRRTCSQIQTNYKALSAASQDILHEQTEKFDAVLGSCLRRLWLAQKHEGMIRLFDAEKVAKEIKQLEGSLQASDLEARVREAFEQNLQIKRKLLESGEHNEANRTALLAELDSLESLLELLLQRSVAATDASDFSSQMDDIVAQAEADAKSVQEMEALVSSVPDLEKWQPLSEKLRAASTPQTSPQTLPRRERR